VGTWHRLDADRNVLCIELYVQPGARTTEVVGKHGDALKIRVAAPALEDRANALLVEFLRRKLDLPASGIIIVRGARGRRKSVEIFAPGEAALRLVQDWDKT